MSDWQEKIRIICTYHSDEGTSGYCLSNKQFDQLEKLIQQERVKAQEEVREKMEIFYAYCSCGDTLERKGVYPDDSKYYCLGCDTAFKLKEKPWIEEE